MHKFLRSSEGSRCALGFACRSQCRRTMCRSLASIRLTSEQLKSRGPQHHTNLKISDATYDQLGPRTTRTTAAAGLPNTTGQAASQTEDDPSSLARRRKKFERFSTPAARDYRQALLNFRHQEEVKDGTVVVRPLSLEDLAEVTETMTQVFVATDDKLGLYTRYMRGEIRQYLTRHLQIAPDAVILVATLHPKINDWNGSSSTNGSSIDNCSNDSASSNGSNIPVNHSSDTIQSRRSENPSSLFVQDDNEPPGPHQWHRAANDVTSKTSSSAEPDSAMKEVFLGAVEVAFTEATRTTFLTLNPPKECAYLGNLCVVPRFRRRGYGKVLLRAGEQLTRLASFPAIFLHLRFKDPGAAALYEAEGYYEVKRDLWLLSFVGYSRRFLMKKQLTK